MKKFTKAFTSNITSSTSPTVEKKAHGMDASGCPNMEGLLLRLNAHNEWKKRHGKLQDTFFITNKPKHKKPTSEIKERIDLRDVASVGVYEDVLEIEMHNGEVLQFKHDAKDATGGDIDAWYQALNKRHVWAQTQPGGGQNRARAKSEADPDDWIFEPNRIHVSGYLQKKSHNKYNGMQERFVKLEGKNLSYFKKKTDDTALGTASMDTADFVRPYDASADCAIFEIQDEDRVFVFQTTSHAEMVRWVTIINKVLTAYKERKQAQIVAKIAEETPFRVRVYDDVGEAEFLTKIEMELSELYPTMEMEPDMTLKEHVGCANAVLGYLMDFVPEVQSIGVDRVTRYDILAAVMTEVNTTLTERLSCLVLPTTLSSGAEQRETVYENATLGDLHTLIDWIARYQVTLKSVKCPVANSTTAGSSSSGGGGVLVSGAVLSLSCKNPKSSGVFGLMPGICKLYVHGGSAGAKGGAAHHLYDHCMKVWSSVVNNPEEMIQRHSNGSFYTHAPIDMWEAINQHVALATATNSPILHVLIAEKVVTSLSAVFNNIITYVQTLDTSDDAELQGIELEYISALANDTALHIEEVIELIDTFTISEIRERIDDIFDPLTTLLVQCGQACLKRLAMKVMTDVQSTLDEVFMPEWIEGNQVHVVTTTISDYMNDFETFLVEFWAAKFSYTILEAVILAYIRVILFKKGVQAPPTTPTTPDSPAPKMGFFSSLMRKTAEISQKVMNTGPQQCPVDEESLGRLAQDVNTLNAFFYKKAGQDVATEFLAIINEISLMLFLDGPALVQHAASRATEFPSAAAAIKIAAQATMRMRPETIGRAHFDLLHSTLDPLISTAPQRLQQQEAENIAEDRLSLLYTDLIPPGMLVKPVASQSLAQKLKNMSHVNLGGVNVARQSSNDTGDDGSDCDSASEGRASSSGRGSMGRSGSVGRAPSSDKRNGGGGDLVDDIIGVLNTHDEEDAAYLQALEEERQREEALRKRVGVLAYDGHMEKKSPAHNQWQRRWFKLVTRETMNPEMPYIYSFNWYKQEGAKVSNSLTVDQIKCISVLASCRALSYLPLTQTLSLQSEALNVPLAMVVKVHDPDAATQPNTPVGGDKEQWVTIRILQTDGKDHVLRGAKVDRVIKWINLLSLAASLGYDEHEHTWTRNAFERNKEAAADYALQHPFIAPSSGNSASGALFKPGSSHKLATGSGQSSQNSPRQGGELPPPGKGAGIDPEEAAAAIKAMKIEESKREAEERALAAQRREEARLAQEEEERLDALELEREEEAEREAERAEQARAEKAEKDLQAARAAAFKRKAEKDAARAAEKERVAKEAAEAERLQREAEEAERAEKEVLEQEARERRQRNLARQQGIVDDDESPAPASPGASPNPILQKDGKAKDVVNPLKRVSSIRRVPPPPPPPAAEASPTPAPAPEPALAALSVQTFESNTSTTSSVDEPEAAASTPTSKPPAGKVIRMVGKRRASQQKVAHNTANAVSSENGSSMSGSSRADESDEEVDARRASDEDSLVSSPASSPMGRSLLKKNLAALQEQDSPLGRPSESPGGTGRKSLSRGVSFAADTRDVNRFSESDTPTAPAASPATLTRINSASRAPFSSAPAPADEDSERDSDHARSSLGNNNNIANTASTEDGEAEDTGAVATEQELSMLARKEGVVSGKLYRRSVVIMKKPTVQTPPEKEGYLMKKSPAMFAGWQKRYFLTNSNGDIEYYKSEADARNGSVQPQGVIMTKYIKTDRGVEVNEKELDINIGSKTVHLRATDKAEARAWQSNITQWMLHSA